MFFFFFFFGDCASIFFDGPCVLIHSTRVLFLGTSGCRSQKQLRQLPARVVFRSGGKHGHGESHTWAATILLAFACGLAQEDNRVVVASPGTLPSCRGETHTTWGVGPGFRWKFGAAKGGQVGGDLSAISPAEDGDACRTPKDAQIGTQ